MKKICFFSGDITRNGGTEKVSILIANELKRQGKYEIFFLSLTEQKNQPFFSLEQGIKRFSLGDKWIQPGPAYLPVIHKLRRFLKEQKIDILIDIDIVLDILSLPASKGMKTKVISWEHFNCEYEQSILYRRFILKYSVKRSDYIITLTEDDRVCYCNTFGRSENIRAIYNPMEIIQSEPTAQSQQGKKYIVTVGRLIQRKGIDYLARIAVRVLKKYKDWSWILLGDGEERTFLEKVISDNQLENQLILKGNVTNVADYLVKAEIFVMTSRVEGLPMCLLEAKANHLPCISFCIRTGPKEIIEDGVNGYLIPPFDCDIMTEKIELLIQNETLRKEFSENACHNIEKFQMTQIIKNWNEVIELLCG